MYAITKFNYFQCAFRGCSEKCLTAISNVIIVSIIKIFLEYGYEQAEFTIQPGTRMV